MRLIKKILIIIVIIISIPLIIALFVRKEYVVKRDIIINKPQHEVYNYVKQLKNQDQYSKWVRMDPQMKKHYTGTDGTVGFVYAWNSETDAGEGEQEIKNLVENEKVDVEIRFKRPMESVAMTPITMQNLSANETKLTWAMQGKSFYPLNFMNLFMDNMLGKDLDVSLRSLKSILENKQELSSSLR
jgi:hypothetical protein